MAGNSLLKKSSLSVLIALLSLAVLVLPVMAATITLSFEDAPFGASVNKLPYPGVRFNSTNWLVIEGYTLALSGRVIVGPCLATLRIDFEQEQSAVGFRWSSIDHTLQVEAFLNGSPVSTSHFAGPYGSSASVTGPLNALVIGGGTENGCAAIDDLTYSSYSDSTFTDGRINRRDMGSPVVLFPQSDGGLDVYAADGSGLVFRVSPEQIAAVAACPERNTTIAQDEETGVILSRLAARSDGTCPFQLNAPTAETDKTYVIIFDELSTSTDYESFEG